MPCSFCYYANMACKPIFAFHAIYHFAFLYRILDFTHNLKKNHQNTRPRDYYDIYILLKLQSHNIGLTHLKAALETTCEKRGSKEVVRNYISCMDVVKASSSMQNQWKTYQTEYEYAADISFDDACDAVISIMKLLES